MDYELQMELNEGLRVQASKGNVEGVTILLDQGADINHLDETSQSALHHAIASKSSQLVHFLIKEGADVNNYDEDNMGDTPISHAAKFGLLRIAKMLLRAGADPYIAGTMGHDALHQAQAWEDTDAPKICQAIIAENPPPKNRRQRQL